MSEQVNERAMTVGALPAFPAFLLERQLVNRQDLAIAEEYAVREKADLVDAVVTLGLVQEADSYGALALAAGTVVHSSSQIAIERARGPARVRKARAAPQRGAHRRRQSHPDLRHVPPLRRRGRARSLLRRGTAGRRGARDALLNPRRARPALSEAAGARAARRAAALRRGRRRPRRARTARRAGRVAGHRLVQPVDRPRRRARRERPARRLHERRRQRAVPHLRRARTDHDAAGERLAADPQPLQDHGEGGHLGASPPAGRRVPRHRQQPADRRPLLDAADRRRREDRHARHRQPQPAAGARSSRLRRRPRWSACARA